MGTQPFRRGLFAGFFLLSCQPAEAAPSEPPPAELRFGMSTALSGVTCDLGVNGRDGVLAGFERINRAGGIHGHPLRLTVLDDGYEPHRTAPNMRRLTGDRYMLGIIGNMGTPTSIASIPICLESRTLLFAPFTGAGVARKTPPDRYVINYRPSYAEETGALIDALIDGAGLLPREIAFFTQRDGFGDAGYAGALAALFRHGLEQESSVAHVRYERNTLAVDGALAELLMAETTPRAVVMLGAYGPCAAFIQSAREQGLDSLFLSISVVGSISLARSLGPEANGVIVSQVVPHPIRSQLPVVGEFRSDLEALDASLEPTFGSLEGYLAARVLALALERAEPPYTRESVVDALESLGTFDLGLDGPLHLDRTSHQASHQIWPTVLEHGEFVPCDWSAVRSYFRESTAR